MGQRSLPLSHLYQGRVLNFAHRGARRQAPENTLPAFERAAELGADGVELDVQLSADGYPMVFHDADLSKTSSGHGPLREQPLAALKELDAGSYFASDFAGTAIPTLDEVFECVGHRLLINVELKYFGSDRRYIDVLTRTVVSSIRRHRLDQRVILSSFNPLMLRRARQIAADLPLGYLTAPDTPELIRQYWVARLLIGAHQARHIHCSMVDAKVVSQAHQGGYRVNVWTVNEPVEMRRMVELGVDMIMSDFPDRVYEVLGGARTARS